MSDFLSNLVDRSFGEPRDVVPRLPARFEPGGVGGVVDEPGDAHLDDMVEERPAGRLIPERPPAVSQEPGSEPVLPHVVAPAPADTAPVVRRAPEQPPPAAVVAQPAPIEPRAEPSLHAEPFPRVEPVPFADASPVSPRRESTTDATRIVTPVVSPREPDAPPRTDERRTAPDAPPRLSPLVQEPAIVEIAPERREPARPEPPAIRVSIGRIEVRATTPPPPRAPVATRRAPARYRPPMSLNDYLKRRNGGQ